jgi:hypothetical protein
VPWSGVICASILDTISVKHVVIAVGFKYFKYVPPDLAQRLPEARCARATRG